MAVVRYVLEWQRRSEPVQGRLIAPDASEQSFTGWLEFLAVAEKLRSEEPDEPDEPDEPGDSMSEVTR